MTMFFINSNCELDLDFNNLKPKLAQATVMLNMTVMFYEDQLINGFAIAIIKSEYVCHLRGHNSVVMI